MAQAEIEDKAEVEAWTFNGDGLEVNGDTATLGQTCHDGPPAPSWGEVTLIEEDGGWLITSIEPYPTFGSCGG